MKLFRYSAIDCAYNCLKLYELRYLKNVSFSGPMSADLEFGTALHAGLEACMRNEGLNPSELFKTYWNTLKGKDLATSRLSWEALGELGPLFLDRFQRLHKSRINPMHIEQHLVGEIGGFPFEGTPDLLGDYKGIPSVIDFKTSNYEYPKEKILVNEQMPVYAHLAKQQLGYEAKQIVYYVFIKSQQRIQVIAEPLTEKLLTSTLQNVTIMCKDLSTRTEFPRNPNTVIRGKSICPCLTYEG